MSAITIQQMADRVAALLEERLRMRGAGLDAKLQKSGHQLPRKVRNAAKALAVFAAQAQNPKLLMQIDQTAVADAYDICLRHLGAINPRAHRFDRLVGIAASIAFVILTVAVLVVVVLRWRGFI